MHFMGIRVEVLEDGNHREDVRLERNGCYGVNLSPRIGVFVSSNVDPANIETAAVSLINRGDKNEEVSVTLNNGVNGSPSEVIYAKPIVLARGQEVYIGTKKPGTDKAVRVYHDEGNMPVELYPAEDSPQPIAV